MKFGAQRDACMVVATSFRSRHTLTNGTFRMALCACDRPAKVLAKQALIGFTIDLNEEQQYHWQLHSIWAQWVYFHFRALSLCIDVSVRSYCCFSVARHDSMIPWYTLTRSDGIYGIYGMVASSTLLAFTHFSHWFFTLAKPHCSVCISCARIYRVLLLYAHFHFTYLFVVVVYKISFLLSHIILRAIKKKEELHSPH